jgi:hypothetical protein
MMRAQNVILSAENLTVELNDGRAVSAPLAWFPRLLHGTPEERNNWRLIGNAEGIHWSDLDEDISVENLLRGKPSGESRESFNQWLRKRSISLATLLSVNLRCQNKQLSST